MIEQKNYTEYTFKPEATFEVNGDFLEDLQNFISEVRQNEQKITFSLQVEDPSKFFEQVPTVQTTQLGMMAEMVASKLYEHHIKNVDKGNGILRTELERPKLELVKP